MNAIKVTIILILISGWAYSQTKIKYDYILNERIGIDSEAPLLGMEQEFSTERKYYSPSVFSETRLFTGDSKKGFLFRIENNIWCYRYNNDWKLLYNYIKRNGGIVYQFGARYNLSFEKEVCIRGVVLHRIALNTIEVLQSHIVQYYFSSDKGVLIVKTSNAILLRSDSFKYKLTDQEIDIL